MMLLEMKAKKEKLLALVELIQLDWITKWSERTRHKLLPQPLRHLPKLFLDTRNSRAHMSSDEEALVERILEIVVYCKT